MLSLYYVSATFLQAWRIKNICNKIAEKLAQQASVAFYTLPAASDGYDANLATSELCTNREVARVSDILWLSGHERGCCLKPRQSVHIGPWITFPEAPSWLPFAFESSAENFTERLAKQSQADRLYLLLETEIQPSQHMQSDMESIRIEDYGKLIAWRIDSHLALLIESDLEHFTKLLIATFLQNNLLINDQLPLNRIESINYEGKPQPFEMLASHLPKSTRANALLSDDEWRKHLECLHALSILANQATEFEYKKNRTEGKTGVVKPDLIPHDTTAETPKQTVEKLAPKEAAKDKSPSKSPAKSPVKSPAKSPIKLPIQVTTTVTASNVSTIASPVSIKTPEVLAPKPASTSPIKLNTLSEAPATSTVLNTTAATNAVEEVLNSTKLPAPPPTASQMTSPAKEAEKTDLQSSSNLIETVTTTTTTTTITSPSKQGKLKAKPTQIKPPTALTATDGRFKTTKITETPSAKTPPTSIATKSTTQTTTPKKQPITKTQPVLKYQSTPKPIQPSKESNDSKLASAKMIDLEKSALQATATDASNSQPVAESKTSTSDVAANPSVSAVRDNTKRPSLRRNKDSLRESKPLNILVYSDSVNARDSTVATLKDILEKDMYTIYPMTPQQVQQKYWLENTALLVVCGTVASNVGEIFVDFFLHGGKVLSLCSDILHFILPTYRTAEVREHELVQFSYDRWQRVQMMHHIFCYQPSPVKKNFSTDSDDSVPNLSRKPALVCPRSIELKDMRGDLHNLDVKVLGTEETWNTPSLLLANSVKSGGKAVFSQVHLETSPTQFETDEAKYVILKRNEKIRLDIFSDLLAKHLNVNVNQFIGDSVSTKKCIYQNAYFLGHHESKFHLLEKLKEETGTVDNVIKTSKLTMHFCGKNDKPPHANTNLLPILIHSCPEDFSTVDYFEHLTTMHIGRLVIYAPIVSSSMNVINELDLIHGLAVLVRQQTEGMGRSNNQWLSPLGCAMFSIQLHISLDSPLGVRLPLVQHIVATAMVNAIKIHPIYKVLDIGIKWPNDIYANGSTKIGGLIVKTTLIGNNAVVNIGCGINLDNSKPTICINDLVNEYNRANHNNLPLLKYEKFIAMMFNEIERLVNMVQEGNFEQLYQLYYDLWLHNEEIVSISDIDGVKKSATILGIDDYGYLKVQLSDGSLQTVQPDGNTFDILKGLIVPKFN